MLSRLQLEVAQQLQSACSSTWSSTLQQPRDGLVTADRHLAG